VFHVSNARWTNSPPTSGIDPGRAGGWRKPGPDRAGQAGHRVVQLRTDRMPAARRGGGSGGASRKPAGRRVRPGSGKLAQSAAGMAGRRLPGRVSSCGPSGPALTCTADGTAVVADLHPGIVAARQPSTVLTQGRPPTRSASSCATSGSSSATPACPPPGSPVGSRRRDDDQWPPWHRRRQPAGPRPADRGSAVADQQSPLQRRQPRCGHRGRRPAECWPPIPAAGET